jgi:hypothetical protein
MLAAVQAGWQITQLAPAASFKRHTASKRVVATRERGLHPRGIDVPPVPQGPRSPLAVLRKPIKDRGWLRVRDALLAGVSKETVHNWRHAGRLPHSKRIHTTIVLYLRAELLRVTRVPATTGAASVTRPLGRRLISVPSSSRG